MPRPSCTWPTADEAKSLKCTGLALTTGGCFALAFRYTSRGGATPDKIRTCFRQTLEIGRLQRAWDLASTLKDKDLFAALGEAALKQLDIPTATRVYRQLGDAGLVMALRKLEGLEDAHLLSGHLALIFDDHAGAQAHFLQSTRPLAALEMRRDLLHWKQALDLAKTNRAASCERFLRQLGCETVEQRALLHAGAALERLFRANAQAQLAESFQTLRRAERPWPGLTRRPSGPRAPP